MMNKRDWIISTVCKIYQFLIPKLVIEFTSKKEKRRKKKEIVFILTRQNLNNKITFWNSLQGTMIHRLN